MDNPLPNISNYKSQNISKEALRKEIGLSIANRVISKCEKTKNYKIPDVEMLRVGDVILTRECKPGIKSRLISKFQLEQDGIDKEASTWCHAMVYVGNMQVVESTKKRYWNNFRYKNGPRLINLTEVHQKSEKIICRCTHIDEFTHIRHSIGRYALIDLMTNSRRYSSNRIIEMLSSSDINKANASRLAEEIICSEYALELLARGGGCLVKEYESIDAEEKNFFYPANFHVSEDFKKLEFSYLNLVD